MGKVAKGGNGAAKPRAKSELYRELAEIAGINRKQVAAVFDGMAGIMRKDLTKGPGVFAVPGLMKVTVIKKPATKATQKPNPFKPGEMMMVKARPARKVVKVRALKGLKAMV